MLFYKLNTLAHSQGSVISRISILMEYLRNSKVEYKIMQDKTGKEINIKRFCLLKKRNSIYKVKNNNDALPKSRSRNPNCKVNKRK